MNYYKLHYKLRMNVKTPWMPREDFLGLGFFRQTPAISSIDIKFPVTSKSRGTYLLNTVSHSQSTSPFYNQKVSDIQHVFNLDLFISLSLLKNPLSQEPLGGWHGMTFPVSKQQTHPDSNNATYKLPQYTTIYYIYTPTPPLYFRSKILHCGQQISAVRPPHPVDAQFINHLTHKEAEFV